MESEKLLPCAHCAGQGKLGWFEGGETIDVYCDECGCRTSACDTPELAIAAWNTRAPADLRSALEAETIERVREMATAAYDAGATEVHSYWKRCRPDVTFSQEPDFTEAAADYGRQVADDFAALAPTKGDV